MPNASGGHLGRWAGPRPPVPAPALWCDGRLTVGGIISTGAGASTPAGLSRRPATVDDHEFARLAHHAAYREVVERQFGEWDEHRQDAFFEQGWSQHQYEIIELDGSPCGYLRAELGEDRVDIHELVVHPDQQNRGLGRAILDDTMARARTLGLPVHLQVLVENRAVGLYERIGFRQYGQTATHRLMSFSSD